MTHTLKRVNVSSVFKVAFVINIALLILIGFFTILLPILTFGSLSRVMVIGDADARAALDFIGTAGALSTLCFYLVFVVFGSVVGAVYFALMAWIYNLTSGWIGGVKIQLIENGGDFYEEIEQDIKTKRSSY